MAVRCHDAIADSVEAMWRAKAWKNLAAILTAHLQLEGESAIAMIERRYFRDRTRTLQEIEAAVLALRVHGNTDAAVSRERVLAAYRSFFDDREPLVFLIVPDLTRWKDWESKDRLVAVLDRLGKESVELRKVADEYLKACAAE